MKKLAMLLILCMLAFMPTIPVVFGSTQDKDDSDFGLTNIPNTPGEEVLMARRGGHGGFRGGHHGPVIRHHYGYRHGYGHRPFFMCAPVPPPP